MKTIKFLFSDLNQDERQFLGGLVAFVAGFAFLFWLASTNTMPNLDTKTTDTQTESHKTYELPKFYNKYAQHCYDYNN